MIILQSRLSGLYFKSFGLWVAHVAEALRFANRESARQFIVTERVNDVVVLDTPELEALMRPDQVAQSAESRKTNSA